MYEDAVCEYCAFSFPFDRAQCPHCARPSRFPNVVLAERPEETSALLQRYQTALKKAEKRGERMIDFRASVFEENSAFFFKRKGIKNIDKPPVGFRATWASRGRLALAKLAARLKKSTEEAEFPQVLLAAGAISEAEDFVEVHIYGSMSYRTIGHLVVRKDRVESWFEEALKTMAPDLKVELS